MKRPRADRDNPPAQYDEFLGQTYELQGWVGDDTNGGWHYQLVADEPLVAFLKRQRKGQKRQ